MARKRTNGEGCICKEKSGRYRISVSVWNGKKRIRRTRTAWKHADALAALDELRQESTTGIALTPNTTLSQYLDDWMKLAVTGNVAENTLTSYEHTINQHIKPFAIGSKILKKLKSRDIRTWLKNMEEEEFGSRTRENAYVVLRSAIILAVEDELILKNPMAKVSKPRHDPKDMMPFTVEESIAIMAASVGHRYHALIVLGITTGMRTGELLGLNKTAIDFKAKTVSITQQATEIKGVRKIGKPKTEKSIRTIALTDQAIEALRAHLQIQLREGNGGNDLMFPSLCGGIESRSNLRQRTWIPLLKNLGLAHRGFHNTRHTYATISLANGVDVMVVSANLGHSKVSVTMDTYAHAMPNNKLAAADKLSRLFSSQTA